MKKNPLFVVKKKGKEVEMADGIWDALWKKLSMEQVIFELLTLASKVGGLDAVQRILSKLIEDFRTLCQNFVLFLQMFNLKFLG